MVKKMMTLLLAIALLGAGCAAAQAYPAVIAQQTMLLDAPGGTVRMTYYIGTAVTVLAESGDGQYAQIAVGEGEGSLTGWAAMGDLAVGTERMRRVHPTVVHCSAQLQPCTLYAQPDEDSAVLDSAFHVEAAQVFGCLAGEWMHLRADNGLWGFISLRENDVRLEEMHTPYAIEVERLPGELTEEAAIAAAKAQILADLESGALLGMGMDQVTAEGLDAHPAEVLVQAYDGIGDRLFYDVGFMDEENGYYYAWIVLEVQGEEIVGYSYGSG